MDNKDLNRDKLLDEILRETAAHKTEAPAEPPTPRTTAPISHAAEPEAPPVYATSSMPRHEEPEPVHTYEQYEQPAPAYSRSQTEELSFTGSQWAEEVTGEPQDPVMDKELHDDLEGDSQPTFQEGASAAAVRTRKKHRPHRVISALIMTIVIIGVSVMLSSLLIIYGRDLLGINSDNATKIVTIQPGDTMDDISASLQKAGIITKPNFFKIIAGMSNKDGDIRPGDHELRPDMAYETILSELISDPLDSSLSVSVTFPEGISVCEVADLLEENNVCSAAEFLDYFNNDAKFGLAYEDYLPSFMDDKFYRMEGYCFPDTYTFYQEMDVELVCEKILENFNSKITQDDYDRMEALNMTLDETITLASMIQAEAGSLDQMPTISSVFWNRLNNATEFPLLQSDPTTKYVEEIIKPHSESYNESLYISYDTYQCTGLPAGPIGNPGADAIQAALHPETTDYYFFYANIDTKETYFAKTLEEHEANQKKVAADQEAAADASEAASDDSAE